MWSNENWVVLRAQLLPMSKIQQGSLTFITQYFQGTILFSILTPESVLSVFLCLEMRIALSTESYTDIPLKFYGEF